MSLENPFTKQPIRFGNVLGRPEQAARLRQDPIDVFIARLGDTAPDLAHVAPSSADFSYLPAGQRAESLWATFQDIKGLLSGRKIKGKELSKADWKSLEIRVSHLKALYADEETRQAYLDAHKNYVSEVDGINGEYEKYQALKHQVSQAEATIDLSAKYLFSRRGMTDESDRLTYEIAERSLEKDRERLERLTKNNPDLAALVQYETFVSEARELRKTGFDWSPSRRKLLKQIRDVLMSGTPIFLFGETGTGKSSLAEEAVKKLTGRPSVRTKGKNNRLDRMIAKDKVDVQGNFFQYIELGRAYSGSHTKTCLSRIQRHGGLRIHRH